MQPAARAALAGTVTVAVWSVRVIARILQLVAALMVDVADAADAARGRGPAKAQPAATAPAQPTLTP
jgi:hypothetical protein